jgi:sugar transferase EpsL
MYRKFGKRFLDLMLAVVAGILLLPLMLVVAAVVRIGLGSPVIFLQPRAGKQGSVFTLMKFRTMRDAVDPHGRVLSDALRLSTTGKWLRALSLDELPQLWNVIRGDMSLVGPRPLLVAYVERYTHEQRRRLEVRPGITGFAQIMGRNAISWEEKFRHDVWYVENYSFFLDLWILARTCLKVVSPRGVSASGHATMPEFMGTDERMGNSPDSNRNTSPSQEAQADAHPSTCGICHGVSR